MMTVLLDSISVNYLVFLKPKDVFIGLDRFLFRCNYKVTRNLTSGEFIHRDS